MNYSEPNYVDILFKCANRYKKNPFEHQIYIHEGKRYKIGDWYHKQKLKINTPDDTIYNILSQNIYIKQDLDDYLIDKYKKITQNRYFAYKPIIMLSNVSEYLNEFKMLDDIGISISIDDLKGIIHKNRMLHSRFKPLEHVTKETTTTTTTPTDIGWIDDILFENTNQPFQQQEKETTTTSTTPTDIGWIEDILFENTNQPVQQQDENVKLLFEYVNRYRKTPKLNDVYIKDNKEFEIGKWYSDIKKTIYTFFDEMYLILAENPIVKDNLDMYILSHESKSKRKLRRP